MRDPVEGRTSSGTIRTGAHAARIQPPFRGLLDEVVTAIASAAPAAAVYVYGSVATGQAEPGRSDVDLLTIGLPTGSARVIGRDLSERSTEICRGVEVGVVNEADLAGLGDEAYGFRVFLRHYCVHLAGPVRHRPGADFPADARAARGFNGDIAHHRDRWRAALGGDADPRDLARVVARKTLLAVGGLVSVHDATWTTDRGDAVARWSEIAPELASGLVELSTWVDSRPAVTGASVTAALDHTVDPVVERFERDIGLWT